MLQSRTSSISIIRVIVHTLQKKDDCYLKTIKKTILGIFRCILYIYNLNGIDKRMKG